jgi:cytochrome P450
VTESSVARSTVVAFDHYGADLPEHSHQTYQQLRNRCPVGLTESWSGFWLISGYSEVVEAARDDLTFSSEYTLADTPEHAQVHVETEVLGELLYVRAAVRRARPTDDFLSFMANLEIDGDSLPLAEVVGNGMLLLAGGTDTTTALLSESFLHLSANPELRHDPVRRDEELRNWPPTGSGRPVRLS